MRIIMSMLGVAFALAASAARAEPPVESFYASPACGPTNYYVYKEGTVSKSLRLSFGNLQADTGAGSMASRDCEIVATIRVAAGKSFRASAAQIGGVYTMQGSSGGIMLGYGLDQTGGRGQFSQSFRPFSQGDFQGVARIDNPAFTPCATFDQIVTLRGTVRPFVSHGQGFSFVTVDETTQDHDLSWNWQWQPCPSAPTLFGRPFTTYYRAYNGVSYRAIVRLQGASGTYSSDAGFVGQLFNVTYASGGREANGQWHAQGRSGWFRFFITDPQTGNFDGQWGDNTGPIGEWWGYFQ